MASARSSAAGVLLLTRIENLPENATNTLVFKSGKIGVTSQARQ
jgi:hypothetical protein